VKCASCSVWVGKATWFIALNAAHFLCWNTFSYHHNPWDINDFLPCWLEFTIFFTAETVSLLSEPFTNSHFHCFGSVERSADKYALHSWRSWHFHPWRREGMEKYPCACSALCPAETHRLNCSDGPYFTSLIENMSTLAAPSDMWHFLLGCIAIFIIDVLSTGAF